MLHNDTSIHVQVGTCNYKLLTPRKQFPIKAFAKIRSFFKCALNFVMFSLLFHPILHISAIAAYIADNRDFFINVNPGKGSILQAEKQSEREREEETDHFAFFLKFD